MQKVLVIVGQTATGKSDLAVKIALRLRSGSSTKNGGGEIISADSRQVYKGLDIGTGKITKAEMRGVRHHMLDVVSPNKVFTVAEYQKQAIYAMADIGTRGKIPIICGGTGFYIDAVTKGIILPEVPPNLKLRKILEKKLTPELITELRKLDKGRLGTIDVKNRVRLIRAIEIAKYLGKVPHFKNLPPNYEFTRIGLKLPKEELGERIEKRLRLRIKAGMLKEAQKLHKQGMPWKRMQELGLEYKYMALYLQNKISKGEMIVQLNAKIYQYAKRQMTWFKRDPEIKWYDVSEITLAKVAEKISKLL